LLLVWGQFVEQAWYQVTNSGAHVWAPGSSQREREKKERAFLWTVQTCSHRRDEVRHAHSWSITLSARFSRHGYARVLCAPPGWLAIWVPVQTNSSVKKSSHENEVDHDQKWMS